MKLLAIPLLAAALSQAYDQSEEADYLANFPTLASTSYSDTIHHDLLSPCIDQPKIAQLLTDVIVTPSSSSAITSSEVLLSYCNEFTHCIIPSNVTLRIDSHLNVGALTLLDGGRLEWDDSDDDGNIIPSTHYLCAGYILVVGSASSFSLTLSHELSWGGIYIKNNGATPTNVDHVGMRVLGTNMGGNMIIQGRGMKRTWSLLSGDFQVGDGEMQLLHNVDEMGWKVGDRIGVAPTNHGSSGKGQTFEITAITSPHTIQLSSTNTNAQTSYQATFINGHSQSPPVLKSAEVINLSRNVLITGDDFEHIDCGHNLDTASGETSSAGCKCGGKSNRTKCTVGLHTIHIAGAAAAAGVMQISNTRVEKCGQRGIEGKYCLHFHKAGDCPDCIFANNAVEYGHQRGITVHGTHRSTVTGNVVWDVRGANVYIEDGNEMHNDISYNVAVCPHSLSDPIQQGCSIPGTSTPSADAPNAAFYSKAASNDWTGNRAANTYNGMLLDAKKTQGSAMGNVCPSEAALGRWVGNTIHGCSRFGLYTLGAPGNFPKRTDRSIHTNGFNQNFQLCEGYDTTEIINPGTTDRGHPGAFYENVDYHNVFVGHYGAGDLQHRGHSSVNNNNLIYWKETKNFADGCSSHFYDSFYQDGNLALPDQGTVIMSNTKFGQNVHLEANHHCNAGITGLLCMPQYIFDNISWEKGRTRNWLSFHAGFNDDGGVFSMAPGQEDSDNGFFPKDFYSVAGSTYAYLLGSPGPRKCVDSTSLYTDRYDNGILCNAPLRSFKIYTRGLTEASAKMLKVQVWWNNRGLSGQIGSANSEQLVGFHRIGDPGRTVKQGYSFPIMSGLDQSYRISLFDPSDGSTDNLPLDWVIEFSDPVIGNRFGTDDQVYVNILGRSCGTDGNGLITSQHDRKMLWSGDNFIDDSAWGAHGACTEAADMIPVDCTAIVGGNASKEGSIEASECPELCSSSPCNDNSYCHCGMPSTCKCNSGFSGPDCSVDLCSSANCGLHGSCVAKHLGGEGDVTIHPSLACICEEGWFGEKCDSNPCEIGEAAKTCSGSGKCLSSDGVATECQCETGYSGNDCEVHNLAEGKASSSNSEKKTADRAFDGDSEGASRWESMEGVNDSYLQVDLGQVYNIDKVTLIWHTSSAKSYDIQVSEDGDSFTTVWSKTDGIRNMGTVDSLLEGVIGRFIRMQGYERATSYGYSIYEMKVFGTIGPTNEPTPYPTWVVAQNPNPPTPDNCSECANVPPPFFVSEGRDCDSNPDLLLIRCTEEPWWVTNRYCELSCYSAGLGYGGTNCCETQAPTIVLTDQPTRIPTAKPTINPIQVPTDAPINQPSFNPSSNPPTPDNCAECANVPPPFFVSEGRDCDSNPDLLLIRCTEEPWWVTNRYCELSCYNAGLGYEGSICC